ncbi:FAD-dependent oxidoreductase [Chroogloeocystis siderophila]
MNQQHPPQKTAITKFFLAGSYIQQDNIDSIEGATLAGCTAAQAF